MKTRFTIIAALLMIAAFTQGQEAFFSPDTTFENQCRAFEFTNVIKVDSTFTKDQLYSKVKQWFAEAFVSSKNVIDNADKDEGIVYGHAIVDAGGSYDGYVSFNIEVRCKNGKVKYLLSLIPYLQVI